MASSTDRADPPDHLLARNRLLLPVKVILIAPFSFFSPKPLKLGIVPIAGRDLHIFILVRPGIFDRHDDFSSGGDSTPDSVELPPVPAPPPRTSSSAASPVPAAPRRPGRARPSRGAWRR